MKLLLFILVLSLTGCGLWNRGVSNFTGVPVEICHDKVVYLMFTTGATVKYNSDGKIETCRQ